MNPFEILLTPLGIGCIVIFVGFFVGKINIKGISIGISGILIVSLFVGIMISLVNFQIDSERTKEMMITLKTISKLGLSLFVASFAAFAGINVKKVTFSKQILSFIIGGFIVLTGIGLLKLVEFFDKETTLSSLLGVLCGSFTSTPGMSVVLNKPYIDQDLSSLGYGTGYFIGVLFVVILVQIITRREVCESPKKQREDGATAALVLKSVVIICIVIIIGLIMDYIMNEVITFSIGTTGCFLIIGLIVGRVVANVRTFADISKGLVVIKTLGLIAFFVGNGISAGLTMKYFFSPRLLIYSVLFSALPLLLSYFLGVMFGTSNTLIATYLAGGMTSTPAIEILSYKKIDLDYALYSSSYLGAVFTMVFGLELLF